MDQGAELPGPSLPGNNKQNQQQEEDKCVANKQKLNANEADDAPNEIPAMI